MKIADQKTSKNIQKVLKVGAIFSVFCVCVSLFEMSEKTSNQSLAMVMYSEKQLDYFTDKNAYIQPFFATSTKQEMNGIMCLILLGLLLIVGYFLYKYFKHKKLKEGLIDEFQSIESVLNTLPLPMFIMNTDRQILNINKAAEKAFKVNGASLKGKCCNCLCAPNCGTKNCALEKLLHEDCNTTLMDLDKEHYLVITTPFHDQLGKTIGYLEVLQNVSELVETQHNLEARTLELSTISENLTGGVLITALDEGFTVIQCNQGYLDLLGCEEKDVIGKPAVTWLLKEETSNVEERIYEQLKKEGNVRLEHILQCDNGQNIWVSLFGRQTTLHGQVVGVWLLINIDERKRNDQYVKMSEERYRIAVENTNDIIIDYDIEKDIMIHNDRVIDVYGVDTVVGNPEDQIVNSNVIAKESVADFRHLFEELKQGKEKVGCDILTFAKDGREIWCQLNFTTIFNEAKKPIRAIGILHDFTLEKRAILDYQREASYRKVTMEDTALYYEVNLTKRIFLIGHESISQKFLSKVTDDFEAIRKVILEHLVARVDRDKVKRIFDCDHLLQCYQEGETKIEFDYQRMLATNECGWVRCTLYIIEDEVSNDVKILCYVKDIDEAKKLELYLKKQSEIDLLTGLYNKITTEELIKDNIKKRRNDRISAFFIIDLDDFKLVNDTLGHAFGDAVLSEVSQRLKHWFREDDVIGRIGGDEFVVFLKDITKEAAIKQAQSICELFHSMYTGKNDNYKVSGSVGIAFAPMHGTTFDELYQKADAALYSAKSKGKDMYALYDVSLPHNQTPSTTRRIDANAGKQLAGNIGEYVLKILYEAKQPKNVVNAVLELIAKQFHYSRSYIFEHVEEGDYWINTYEWCATGIKTQKDNLQRVKFSKSGYFEGMYNEQGEFICHDMNKVDEEVFMLVEGMGVKSFAQFAIHHDGVMTAFVGFDDCERQWVPEKDDLEALHAVTMLLDVFVLRK